MECFDMDEFLFDYSKIESDQTCTDSHPKRFFGTEVSEDEKCVQKLPWTLKILGKNLNTWAIRSMSTHHWVPRGIMSPFGIFMSTRVTLEMSSFTILANRTVSLIKAVVMGICFSVAGLITLDRLWNFRPKFSTFFQNFPHLEFLANFFNPFGLISKLKQDWLYCNWSCFEPGKKKCEKLSANLIVSENWLLILISTFEK